MSAKTKELAVTLLVLMVTLLIFPLVSTKIAFSDDTGGEIDVFTQKEPYSGKGPNMPSDAFAPGELVILYALVTYDKCPLQNLLVSFYVQSADNTSFSLAAGTNASGIAAINFTIPQKCVNESEVFGEWFVLAHVLIEGDVFQDTLTFNVDWIIKLISVRTIDENLTSQTSFGIGGEVGLEITLRSVAMTMKNVVLAIVIQDELKVPITYSDINDFMVQPNEQLIFLYGKLYIPKWAHVGKATVFVSAFTLLANQSGVPYCPVVLTHFFLTLDEPLTIVLHDVAVVDVVPSVTSIEQGQSSNISVVVRNEGTAVESFNVSAHCNAVLVGTMKITALLPYSAVTLNFILDTSSFDAGNYTITASIPHVLNEADLTDDFFVDGVVEIKPKSPVVIHDIAIVGINISKNTLYIGELLQINVSVVNEGTETETFNVEVYCDSWLIETIQVSALKSGAKITLVSIWNTSFACEGFYQVKASVPLLADVDISDNTFIDGVVQVKTEFGPSPKIHDVAIINVSSSRIFAYVGEVIEIYVVAENQGNFTEFFNVLAFYDSDIIGTLTVECLEPKSKEILVFPWDLEKVTEGNYTLSALASSVPSEKYLENNFYVNGFVEVKAKPPLPMAHDVAVLNVTPSSSLVYIGETVDVNIVVKNQGNYTESFNVTVSYDADTMGILLVENLESNAEKTLVFHWNTQSVPEGNYTLSASASFIPEEADFENNLYVNGVVEVRVAPRGWFVPSWFWWLLPLLLLALLLLIILFYYRKRNKEAEETFYAGWAAWYYCYDLSDKTHEI